LRLSIGEWSPPKFDFNLSPKQYGMERFEFENQVGIKGMKTERISDYL
jgi:hypothetical protein